MEEKRKEFNQIKEKVNMGLMEAVSCKIIMGNQIICEVRPKNIINVDEKSYLFMGDLPAPLTEQGEAWIKATKEVYGDAKVFKGKHGTYVYRSHSQAI